MPPNTEPIPMGKALSEANRLFRLAQEHHYGQGRKIDFAVAASLYRRANEKGHPLAAGFLGVLYASGAGVKKDEEKAQNLCQGVAVGVKAAAAKGGVRAQHLLGLMYGKGLGVDKDDKEAVRWYRKAADQGCSVAQYNLGIMYSEGRGDLPKDESEAVKWFRKAAEQGDKVAKKRLDTNELVPWKDVI
jgi:TPR repeat protein